MLASIVRIEQDKSFKLTRAHEFVEANEGTHNNKIFSPFDPVNKVVK